MNRDEMTVPQSIKAELSKCAYKHVPLGILHFILYSLGHRQKVPIAFVPWLAGALVLGASGGVTASLALLLAAWTEFVSDPENCRLDELRLKYSPDYVPISIFGVDEPPQLKSAGPAGEPPQASAQLPEGSEQEQVEQSQAFVYQPGIATRLGALPVTSQSGERHEPASGIPLKDPVDDDARFLKDFASTPRHLYVIALSGAGKGMWLSNYVRYRKQFEPRLTVFWIDPKRDDKETGYFDEPWIKAKRFKAATMEIPDLIAELNSAFKEYESFCSVLPSGAPALLVIDECLLAQHILDEHGGSRSEKSTLKSQIVRAASIGDCDNKHIVAVSQSPNAGDSGVSGGVLRGLRKVILFRGDELDILHQAKQCGAIPEDLPPNAELKRLCRNSPRNRGIYLNGKYHSLPELTNYSGYDRDSRKWVNKAKDPVVRLNRQFNQESTSLHSTPQPRSSAEKVDGTAFHSEGDFVGVTLPKGVGKGYADKFLEALRSWLKSREKREPVSQSVIKDSSSQQLKTNAKKYHAKGVWISLLMYWHAAGDLIVEGTEERGLKISLPEWRSGEEELTEDDF